MFSVILSSCRLFSEGYRKNFRLLRPHWTSHPNPQALVRYCDRGFLPFGGSQVRLFKKLWDHSLENCTLHIQLPMSESFTDLRTPVSVPAHHSLSGSTWHSSPALLPPNAIRWGQVPCGDESEGAPKHQGGGPEQSRGHPGPSTCPDPLRRMHFPTYLYWLVCFCYESSMCFLLLLLKMWEMQRSKNNA